MRPLVVHGSTIHRFSKKIHKVNLEPLTAGDKAKSAKACKKILAEEEAAVNRAFEWCQNNEIPNMNYRAAYRYIGRAHELVGEPESCDIAINYYQACKHVDGDELDSLSGFGMYDTLTILCYDSFGRYEESIQAFKDTVVQTRAEGQVMTAKEAFAFYLVEKLASVHQHELAIEVLRVLGDEIERYWTPNGRSKANALEKNYIIASGNILKVIEIFKEKLAFYVEANDKLSQVRTLDELGKLHDTICEYDTAINYFEQAVEVHEELEMEDNREYVKIVMDIYTNLAYLHLNRGDKRKAYTDEVMAALKLGTPEHYMEVEDIDDLLRAPSTLAESLVYLDLGQYEHAYACLWGYTTWMKECPEGTLCIGATCLGLLQTTNDLKTRENYLESADTTLTATLAKYRNRPGWPKKMTNDEKRVVYLISQLMCLRDILKAGKKIFFTLLDAELEGYKDDKLYCHSCGQQDGVGVQLRRCGGCKVKLYCDEKHQRKERMRRFLPHKEICPFLNRWRKLKNKQENEQLKDSAEAIFHDFVAKCHEKYAYVPAMDRGDKSFVDVICS